jgi:DNA-binding CsgD family transcriptional regulator
MAKSSARTRDWFEEMERRFARAQYRDAARIYDDAVESGERPSNDAVLLRARILIRNDSKRMVPFLLRHELLRPAPAQSARRAMYLGSGYSRLGEFAEADRHFAEARATFRQGAAFAELACHITRRYADERNFAAAEEWHKHTLLDRSLQGRIRSEHVTAQIFARRQQYPEQAKSVMRVLDLIGDKRESFPEDWYAAVHTLAGLARELPLRDAAKRAKAEVDLDIEWAEDFAVSRFQALKSVAWCQAVGGDELNCLRYLRLAQQVKVAPIWRAILYLDRAFFAAVVGEQKWSFNEFAAAEDIAETVAWDETSGEERVALLLLAEAAAEHAPKRAPFYIARFNQLGKLHNDLQHFTFDDRIQAMASYASGIVKLSAGDKEKAAEHLSAAWRTFDRIGYDFRAAATALALYKATSKSRWLHLAEDKLDEYPRSWLSRRAAKSPHKQPDPGLSRMQATVTQLICEGLTTDDIARRLKLSRNTILNHLKVVYRKVGVNSRQALVVESMKRKLVP